MNSLRKHIQQVVIVSMASLVVLSGMIALFPGRASAAPQKYSDMTVMDQAVAFTSTKAVQSSDCQLRSFINEEQLRTGKWLSGTTNVGLHVDPDDGKVDCGNENLWFTKLMATAGETDFVAASDGIYTQSGGNYRLTSNGESRLQQLIGNAIFGGSIPGTASGAVTYAALWSAFRSQNGCNASESTGGSESAQINIYDEATKTVTPKTYSFNSNNTRVGYNLSVNSDGTFSCNQIAGALSNASLANAVKSYVDTSGNGFASTSTSTAGEDPNLKCGLSNPLNWLLCPMILGINAMISWIDNVIISLLEVDQEKIFDVTTPTGSGYREAWEAFRALAVGILFVAALVTIIAQALGFEILDAYAIKKLFPRLIVAIIGIALSWEIMEFFVVFTNDLGLGIRQLIYYPFRDMPGMLEFGTGAAIAVYFVSGAAFIALGPMGLLSFGLTALMALFVAFLVLVIRQLVIVVLILFAPIAIACYILPNTDGIWKLWYESFTKALMMFPIIVAFLAVGRVFAITAMGGAVTGGAPTAVAQLIGFAAYFMPYFLIPFTFRFAGGAMRTLGGLTNDRSRGGFDRLKKYRAGKTATNMHDLKQGNRFKGNSKAAGAFNAASGGIAAVGTTNLGYNPSKWKSRVQATQSRGSMQDAAEYSEKSAEFATIKGNDDFLLAGLKHRGDEQAQKDYLTKRGYSKTAAEQGVAAIRAAQRATSNDVFDTAATMALPATGTAWKPKVDPATGAVIEGGAGAMHEDINKVAGEDRVKAARMLAMMRGSAAQARRPDLAGGSFAAQLGIMEDQFTGKGGMTSQRASDTISDQVLEAQAGAYIVNARKGVVEAMAPRMVTKLEQINNQRLNLHRNIDLNTTLSVEEKNQQKDIADQPFLRETAVLAGRYEEMSRSAPENARVMADQVLAREIANEQGTTTSIQSIIEQSRGRAAFKDMRREYQSIGDKLGDEANQAAQRAQQETENKK